MSNSTLFSTIAQVLPLLLLALFAERRFGVKDRSTDPTLDAVIAIAVITAAAIGELGALAATSGHSTHSDRSAAIIGIGMVGVLLYADMVWAQVTAHRDHHESGWRRWTIIGAASLATAFAAVLLVLYFIAVYA